MVFKALNNFTNSLRGNSKGDKDVKAEQLSSAILRAKKSFQVIDPNSAFKSADIFSQNALNFINDVTAGGNPYSDTQLLSAYLTSVYMYAALRRVSNLISRVSVVAEIMDQDTWVRLPETDRLNQILSRDMSETLSRMWLNTAIYGMTAVYKTKTRKAILEAESGRNIYGWEDDAVAGLYVIDKPLFEIDEDTMRDRIKGIYVNSGTIANIVGDTPYLDRREFIYYTDWNPENPNRGRSLVSIAIHEAVANASIAQWMAEYFTRGAMPFILVSMDDDDPQLVTESDLLKYKRRFEEEWTGMNSSLRSVFSDRPLKIEQVGISADEVAAPDLNESALEGIAAAVGLDRELIVTPTGGSQERHAVLVKRAWEDTVIPWSEKFVKAIQRDLGLPSNVRLVLDLSKISELDADREERSGIEINIYESGLQTYNEARTRINMPPIEDFDGWFMHDGKLQPISSIIAISKIPPSEIKEFAFDMWDNQLLRRSQVLSLLGYPLPEDAMDGYKYEIEERSDLIQGFWSDDLMKRSDVLRFYGYELEHGELDGYKSELERGADYGEWVKDLWADNLLTRRQTIDLLDIGIEIPENIPDGYSDEIDGHQGNILDLWGDNLLTKSQVLERLGITPPEDFVDGYLDDIESKQDNIVDLWGDNLLTKSQVLDMLGITPPEEFIDGYQDEVGAKFDALMEEDETYRDMVIGLWGENLLKKGQVLDMLNIERPDNLVDAFQLESEPIEEALAEQKAEFLVAKQQKIYEKELEGEEPAEKTITSKVTDIDSVGRRKRNTKENQKQNNQETKKKNDIISDNTIELYKNNRVDYEQIDYNVPHMPNEDFIYDSTIVDTDDLSIMGAEDQWIDSRFSPRGYDDLDAMYQDGIVDTIDPEFLPTADYELDDIDDDIETPELLQSEVDWRDMQDGIDDDPDGYMYGNSSKDISGIIEDHIYGQDSHMTDSSDEESSEDVVPNTLYVSLEFGEEPLLPEIREKVIRYYGIPEAELDRTDDNRFHVTLAYVSEIDNLQLQNSINVMPKNERSFLLHAEYIGQFEHTNDTQTVYLNVEKDAFLTAIQQKVVASFNMYGVPISRYSYPEYYKPHITLFTITWGGGINVQDINSKYQIIQVIKPTAIVYTRENYEIVHRIPLVDGDQDNNNTIANVEVPMIDSDGKIYIGDIEKKEDEALLQKYSAGVQSRMFECFVTNKPYINNEVFIADLWDTVQEIIKYINTDNPDDIMLIKTAIEDGVITKEKLAPIGAIRSIYKSDKNDELRKWEKVAQKSHKKAQEFSTYHIENEVVYMIKDELAKLFEENKYDYKSIKGIFEKHKGENDE